jgi:chemotaxis protein MotA
MFVIIGMLLVIGAIVGGYLMEHGNLLVLMQPAELVIIGGAAVGTLLIGNPLSIVVAIAKGSVRVLMPPTHNTKTYLEVLKMLYELFSQARKQGLVKLEGDVEEPENSAVFSKYPAFLKNHHAVGFLCDTLRMALSGGVSPHELDQMMELDMDVQHQEMAAPASALSTVADSLPGLGIVAAVLGVVITMGAIGGPPEQIGHKVAAALVGTVLGILLCYGFLGPLATNLARVTESDTHYYHCFRVALIAFVRGAAPILAVEFGRRAIPAEVRPSFKEMEAACKGGGAVAKAA